MLQKLIFCWFLVGSLSPLKAQSIFLSFQPDDLGYGIGYRTEKVYASISHGEYRLNEGYMEHSKITLGGVQKIEQSFVTLGLALHSYNKQSPQEFQRIVTYPLSLELGAGSYLDRLSIAFRYDIIKNTSSIDIGIKF